MKKAFMLIALLFIATAAAQSTQVVPAKEAPIMPMKASVMALQSDGCGDVPSVYHAGLRWAWASPCSGGCGSVSPNAVPGWRYATEDEWANRPAPEDFQTEEGFLCAASYFDSFYTHCDYSDAVSGYVTSLPNGDMWESWYVCGAQAPSGDVPEFGVFAAVGILAVAGIFVARRR